MIETECRDKIKELRQTLTVEKEVSKKIVDFVNKRREFIQGKSDTRDKTRESEVNRLGEDRLKI